MLRLVTAIVVLLKTSISLSTKIAVIIRIAMIEDTPPNV